MQQYLTEHELGLQFLHRKSKSESGTKISAEWLRSCTTRSFRLMYFCPNEAVFRMHKELYFMLYFYSPTFQRESRICKRINRWFPSLFASDTRFHLHDNSSHNISQKDLRKVQIYVISKSLFPPLLIILQPPRFIVAVFAHPTVYRQLYVVIKRRQRMMRIWTHFVCSN